MKKATLFAFKEDREALILALQRCGEWMVIAPFEEEARSASGDGQSVQRVENMLKFIARYQEKKGFFAQRPEVAFSQFVGQNDEAQALEAEAARLSQELAGARQELSALEARIAQLAPWMELEIPLDQLSPTRYVHFITGYVPQGAAEAVTEAVEQNDGHLALLGQAAEGRAALIAVHSETAQALTGAIKELGFAEANPPRLPGTAAQNAERMQKQISQIQADIAALESRTTELAGRSQQLELLYDQKLAQAERQAARFLETDSLFFLQGWIRSDRMDRVQKAVAEASEIYDLSFADPVPGEQPPTVEKNNRFVAPFEVITDMFARPDPDGLDPNPVLGPWYWLIFGMMMGDAGYGIIMLILFTLFKKYKKPRGEFGKLVDVLQLASFTTFFWGLMFGSWFGATWMPLMIVPLDDPVNTLVLCLVVGVLHIFSGMLIKVYDEIRKGNVMGALCDNVSWMVLLTGLGLLFIPALAAAGKWMALGGAAVIFLTAGREKKGVVGKAAGGLLGLYNVTSYVSDILSYSRILALSLSTGVVAMVMNLLAGMVQTSWIGWFLSLFIYLLGHSFNLVMGLLSAYVHTSRLQYIEFFGKFYEGSGYAFTPLALSPKYVEVLD
jgi:V/A-type H+-transporting ATPase subunit I